MRAARPFLVAGCTFALWLAAGSAAEAYQFDLVCKGWYAPRQDAPKQSFQRRLRLDLLRRLYCVGSCTTLFEIGRIDEEYIMLRESKPGDLIAYPTSTHFSVNRKTGFLEAKEGRGGGVIEEWSAKCEQAPFSGFGPAQKF